MRKSPATNGARSSHDVCLQLYRMPSAVSTIRAVVLRDGACQARTCCWRLQWYRLRIVSWRHTGLHFLAPSVIHENHVSRTGKSVSGWRLLPLFGSFWAFCIVKQSKWRCKTVKVRPQDWLDDEPILTILERFCTVFLQEEETGRLQKIAYPAEYQEYTENVNKHQKTGLKLAEGCRRGFDGRISMSRKYHTRLCPGSGWYYFIIVAEFFWSLQPGFSSCWYSRCRPSDADNGV